MLLDLYSVTRIIAGLTIMIRMCTIYLLVFVGIAIPQKWDPPNNAANAEGTRPFPFNIYSNSVNVFNNPNIDNLGNTPKLNKNTWNDPAIVRDTRVALRKRPRRDSLIPLLARHLLEGNLINNIIL